MNALVAEWIKFRSLRSNWIVLAIMTVGAIALPVFLVSLRMPDAQYDIANAVALGMSALWVYVGYGYSITLWFVGILTILITTSEFSSGTIQSSLLVRPRRWQFYLVKMAFAVLLGTIIYVALTALGFVSAYITQAGKFTTKPIWEEFLMDVGFVYGPALLGLVWIIIIMTTLAFIFKNSLGSVLGLFVILSMVPPLANMVYYMWGIESMLTTGHIPWFVWLIGFLPTVSLDALVLGHLNGASVILSNASAMINLDFSDQAYWYYSLIALVLYAAVAFLIAYRLLKRRDI
jgi:hypothetical protein